MKTFAALFLFAAIGASAQPITVPINTESSMLSYTGHHPAHSWTGTSRQVAGTLVFDPADPAQSRIELTVPVVSFDSGNANRDSNMLDVVEEESYPTVTFVSESVAIDAWVETADGYVGKWRVAGRLGFHGEMRPVEIPVAVRVAGGRFEATAAFELAPSDFKVKRPRLLMVPIKDRLDFEAAIGATLPATTASR